MTMSFKKSLAVASLLICGAKGMAQSEWTKIDERKTISKDSIQKNGYTLLFINQDSGFNKVTGQRMIDAFFTVYPKEAARFNANTLKKVIFIVDPAYEGVAAASDGIVRVNPKWMKNHPEDIDVVTHEVMHIVQAYPGESGPGWLTEGIADYVRFTFGVNNEAGKWKLPAYATTQSYENSYRITARFLVWIEKNKSATIVDKLDNAMRTKSYTDEIWKKETGSTLNELWKAYGENPVI
ncbi:basic secretory protein-like protein [Chitinophagaceae bacterium DXS]|nr:basic secretory protein-like protein [Chitinophagaceae bacterium DXS]